MALKTIQDEYKHTIMSNAEAYQEIKKASSLLQGLMKHFLYLADTEGFELALFEIMTQAKEVILDDEENLIVLFPGKKRLTCRPPEDPMTYAAWPESFRKLISVHGFISFPDDSGWALNLGDMGGFDYSFLEEDNNKKHFSTINTPEDILNPFTDFSDWWVYHPMEKNPQGEPILCLFSHESCHVEEKHGYNAGSLLITRMTNLFEVNNK